MVVELFPQPCGEDELRKISDSDLKLIIENYIVNIMAEYHMYLDADDIRDAVEDITPIIYLIVFDPQYTYIRYDYKKLSNLIKYLVTRLG